MPDCCPTGNLQLRCLWGVVGRYRVAQGGEAKIRRSATTNLAASAVGSVQFIGVEGFSRYADILQLEAASGG